MFRPFTHNFSSSSNTLVISLVTFSISITAFSSKLLRDTDWWLLFAKRSKIDESLLQSRLLTRRWSNCSVGILSILVVRGCLHSANPYSWPCCVVRSIAGFWQDSATFPCGYWGSSTSKELHTLRGESISLLLNHFSVVAKFINQGQLHTLFNNSAIMNIQFVQLSESSWLSIPCFTPVSN